MHAVSCPFKVQMFLHKTTHPDMKKQAQQIPCMLAGAICTCFKSDCQPHKHCILSVTLKPSCSPLESDCARIHRLCDNDVCFKRLTHSFFVILESRGSPGTFKCIQTQNTKHCTHTHTHTHTSHSHSRSHVRSQQFLAVVLK